MVALGGQTSQTVLDVYAKERSLRVTFASWTQLPNVSYFIIRDRDGIELRGVHRSTSSLNVFAAP